MTRFLFAAAFALGAAVVLWIGIGFVGSDPVALSVTLAIALVYALGCVEMLHYRQATATLAQALNPKPNGLDSLTPWLLKLHPSLQNPVRLRVEGEAVALPGPVFTPYLVGLLVMLGLLGTFIGMVVTLNGAVLALQGTTELETMRQGLATPIKGLGLAFGTSVAGVAASAMLGLISTLSRRERMLVSGQLDHCIAAELRQFSLSHNRQETFKAMQYQAQALPQVAERLQAMAGQMEAMTRTMTEALSASQERFQQTASQRFTELANAVEQSLQQSLQASLAASGRVAGETIQPIVEATLQSLAEQSQQTQQQLQASVGSHLQQLQQQFGATSEQVSQAWQSGLQQYEQRQQHLVANLDQALQQFGSRFDDSTQGVLTALQTSHEQLVQQLGQSDAERLQQWQTALQDTGSELVNGWQQNIAQQQQQQQVLLDQLQEQAAAMAATAAATGTALHSEWHQVLQQGTIQLESRMQAEQEWLQQQQQRMQELTATLRTELTDLRQDEANRSEAAVERLAQLESTVASHLSQLGTALEAPMTRLIATATEAPKAAAEVLEQLREQVSGNIQRDNELLQERQQLMTDLASLLAALESASAAQRTAIESLVEVSTTHLTDIGTRFSQQVAGETDKLALLADHLQAGALEVSSLGEAFGQAVEHFSTANVSLLENLNRVEAALEKAGTRSDEQLAYYVAQAREVIDLSMMSQKEIIEELRHKAEHSSPAQVPTEPAQTESAQTETVAAADAEDTEEVS